MNFYERTKNACKTQGTTLTAMLKKLGLSTSMSSNWKDRGTLPSAEVLIKISDELGISIDYLLKGEDRMVKNQNSNIEEAHYSNIFSPNATVSQIIMGNNSDIDTNSKNSFIDYSNENSKRILRKKKIHITDKSYGELDILINDECPICHCVINPIHVMMFPQKRDNNSNLVGLFCCPSCDNVYAVLYKNYKKNPQNYNFLGEGFSLICADSEYTPYYAKSKELPSEFTEDIFSKTISAYKDVCFVEAYGIDGMIGAAYRRLIDYLVHEYALYSGTDESELRSSKETLGKKINKYLDDEEQQDFAYAINKLSNDWLHFFNNNTDYGYEDLRQLWDELMVNIAKRIRRKRAKEINAKK